MVNEGLTWWTICCAARRHIASMICYCAPPVISCARPPSIYHFLSVSISFMSVIMCTSPLIFFVSRIILRCFGFRHCLCSWTRGEKHLDLAIHVINLDIQPNILAQWYSLWTLVLCKSSSITKQILLSTLATFFYVRIRFIPRTTVLLFSFWFIFKDVSMRKIAERLRWRKCRHRFNLLRYLSTESYHAGVLFSASLANCHGVNLFLKYCLRLGPFIVCGVTLKQQMSKRR